MIHRLLLTFLFVVAVYTPARAQQNPTQGHGAPSGQCFGPYMDIDTGNLYGCKLGAYILSGGVTSQQVAPNMPPLYFSANCGSQTNCVKINNKLVALHDCTTNSTTTVTCPDGNFTSTDQGDYSWVTTANQGVAGGNSTSYLCPDTTIQTVNSPTSITLASPCTGTASGTASLYHGLDDGPTIKAALDTLGCHDVYLQGNILTSQPFGITAQACGLPSIFGKAYIFPEPANFTWTGCTGIDFGTNHRVCFGTEFQFIKAINIQGTGLTSSQVANCANANGKVVMAASNVSGEMPWVDVTGVCPGQAGLFGPELNSLDDTWSYGGGQDVGTYACFASSSAVQMIANDCDNRDVVNGYGLYMGTGAQLQDIGSYGLFGVYLAGTNVLQTHGTHIECGNGVIAVNLNLNGGSSWLSDKDFVGLTNAGSCTQGVANQAGNTVTANDTQFKNGTNAITNGGTFVDKRNNTIVGGTVVTSSGGLWKGGQTVAGVCTGVVTSATKVVLSPNGGTCTTAIASTGTMMQGPGTLQGVSCTSSAAGVASDVCAVFKNGTQVISCSMSGVTFCNATTAVAYVYGDVIGLAAGGGTSTTLANVKGETLAW